METKHKLSFKKKRWNKEFFGKKYSFGNTMQFEVGTCEGIYVKKEFAYCLIAIVNSEEGNGHMDDVMEWFEYFCIRDGREFWIMSIWNNSFKRKLLFRYNFKEIEGTDNVFKQFLPTKNEKQ